jgi:uncharacterized protein (DUF2147 family)
VAALQGHQEKRLGITLKLALGAVGTLLIIQAASSAPTAAGVWRQVDDTGKVGALVTITEDRGVFVGLLSRLFLDTGDDPNPICDKCPGDKLNRPLLGLVFIEGMKQSGLDYDSGTILDPETGKVYSANMHLSTDGALLTVRGYLGLSIFGRSQTWVRVESDDGASAPVDRAPR